MLYKLIWYVYLLEDVCSFLLTLVCSNFINRKEYGVYVTSASLLVIVIRNYGTEIRDVRSKTDEYSRKTSTENAVSLKADVKHI